MRLCAGGSLIGGLAAVGTIGLFSGLGMKIVEVKF